MKVLSEVVGEEIEFDLWDAKASVRMHILKWQEFNSSLQCVRIVVIPETEAITLLTAVTIN